MSGDGLNGESMCLHLPSGFRIHSVGLGPINGSKRNDPTRKNVH